MGRPDPKDVKAPWRVVTCACTNVALCDRCDGYGWYYKNKNTSQEVSEFIAGAMERHG